MQWIPYLILNNFYLFQVPKRINKATTTIIPTRNALVRVQCVSSYFNTIYSIRCFWPRQSRTHIIFFVSSFFSSQVFCCKQQHTKHGCFRSLLSNVYWMFAACSSQFHQNIFIQCCYGTLFCFYFLLFRSLLLILLLFIIV